MHKPKIYKDAPLVEIPVVEKLRILQAYHMDHGTKVRRRHHLTPYVVSGIRLTDGFVSLKRAPVAGEDVNEVSVPVHFWDFVFCWEKI